MGSSGLDDAIQGVTQAQCNVVACALVKRGIIHARGMPIWGWLGRADGRPNICRRVIVVVWQITLVSRAYQLALVVVWIACIVLVRCIGVLDVRGAFGLLAWLVGCSRVFVVFSDIGGKGIVTNSDSVVRS